MAKEEILRKVQAALEYEPRINLHRYPLKIALAEGAVVLEGEVDKVINKVEARWSGTAVPPRGP